MHLFKKLNEREPQLSDHQLLERFGDQQDQAAFGLIVKRHGALVQRVCRGMGLDAHDADDVFQATFLVIARKARSLRRKQSLAPFVHLTSYRFALKVLRFGKRRRLHEKAAAKPESRSAGTEADMTVREARSVMDGELASMADKYRVPLILHFLEGKSREEIARELRVPSRTLSRRIEQGREILQKRLARRGIELSIVLFPLLLAGKVEAAVGPALAAVTAESAALFVQGAAPASAAALLASSTVSELSGLTGPAQVGATLKLWMSKTAFVLVVGGLCAGAWYEIGPLMSRPASDFAGGSTDTPLLNLPRVVRGRILGQDGQPVPQAHVALLASRNVRGELAQHDEVLRQGRADADGAFALEVPLDFPFWITDRNQVKLLACAPGLALSAAPVVLGPGSPSTDIQLGNSAMVRGQVVDNENRPAAGVAVHVVGFGPVGRESIQGADEPRPDALPGWPHAVLTDDEGRFAFAGLDPRHRVSLEVRDDRFGLQLTLLRSTTEGMGGLRKTAEPGDPAPRNADGSADLTIQLAPPQWLEGQVLAADTGKPLAHARLSIVPCEPLEEHSLLTRHVDARADANGCFRMHPLPGGAFRVYACGPDNDPYLTLVQTVPWPQGTMHKEITLALARGIPVQGRIVEADTGRPFGGAAVTFTQSLLSKGRITNTDKDGRFLFPVLPGRGGDLKVQFNEDDYQLRLLDEGGSGGFAPVIERAAVDVPGESPGKDLRLVLQRWGQLGAQAVDGAGKPVAAGVLLTAGQFAHNRYRGARRFEVHDGSFLIPQAEVDGTYPVVLIDAARRHGVASTLEGKAQDPLPRFALEPCGVAMGDLTSQGGSGLNNATIELAAVLPCRPSGRRAEEMETDWYQALSYDHPRQTSSRGKFVLSALVPGVRYRLYAGVGESRRLVKEFTVEPGQKLQLGSLVVRD